MPRISRDACSRFSPVIPPCSRCPDGSMQIPRFADEKQSMVPDLHVGGPSAAAHHDGFDVLVPDRCRRRRAVANPQIMVPREVIAALMALPEAFSSPARF